MKRTLLIIATVAMALLGFTASADAQTDCKKYPNSTECGGPYWDNTGGFNPNNGFNTVVVAPGGGGGGGGMTGGGNGGGGGLAVTGTEAASMAVLGAGLIGIGGLAVISSKRRETTDAS